MGIDLGVAVEIVADIFRTHGRQFEAGRCQARQLSKKHPVLTLEERTL